MAHLSMLKFLALKFVRKWIDWTGRAGNFAQNDQNGCGFAQKLAYVASKNFTHAMLYYILNTPLYYMHMVCPEVVIRHCT
jgi:hypothetical protein